MSGFLRNGAVVICVYWVASRQSRKATERPSPEPSTIPRRGRSGRQGDLDQYGERGGLGYHLDAYRQLRHPVGRRFPDAYAGEAALCHKPRHYPRSSSMSLMLSSETL